MKGLKIGNYSEIKTEKLKLEFYGLFCYLSQPHIKLYMNFWLRKIFLFGCVILPVFVFSQVKKTGIPNVKNYPKSVYNAATQNWDIAQDSKGFMYFANNDGVLRFDGSQWVSLDIDIPLPVRSVFVDSKDRIFVGLIDNFGVLELNNSGTYNFVSLKHLLHSDTSFSDVWKIHEIMDGIVFQAFEKLFIYNHFSEQKIKEYSPEEKYRFSFTIDNKLYVQEFGSGLFEYKNSKLEKVLWEGPEIEDDIISITKIGENTLLIGTINRLYKFESGKISEWKSPVNEFIFTNKLFTSIPIFDDQLAFGTILNGLVITDNTGKILQHLNRKNGLQNNTILSLFSDQDNNLWLGLDNGIDFIEINSPISYISQGGEIGTGYCCIVHNNRIYLGTNQGLFVKPFDELIEGKENYTLIKDTEGQVWSLSVHNKQLICGHNFGTFIINNENAVKISDEPGGWKYITLKNDSNKIIGGFYNGLAIFKYQNNTWNFEKKITGFDQSVRFLVEDEHGYLWISHGAKGIYKITLDNEKENISYYKMYDSNSGLPSNEQNIVFSYQNNSLVSTIDGVYEYAPQTDSFIKTSQINEHLGTIGRLKYFKPDKENNLWFIGEKQSGVLRLNEDFSYTKITIPFDPLLNKFVNEFEFVYPFNDEHTFFAIDNGFAHYASNHTKSYNQSYNSYITKIELNYLDSAIYPIHYKNEIQGRFPFRKNSFRFHFTSPYYENLTDLDFSFYLENFSENWSEWTKDNYKDFTNLFEGDYIFHVKSRNVFGNESKTASYKFTIIPPWHRSNTAFYIYIILSIVLILAGLKYILHRIERSKKREKLKHQNELKKKEEEYQKQQLIAEKEIIKLRNDKLRAEKTHRDKELANQTMNIVQKNRLLKKLDEELQRIQNNTKDAVVVTKLAVIKARIKKELDDKQQNRLFETYFEDVHAEFFKRLKEKYPQLSPGDLRLSAYIRMNISTKEMATLLNITYRGVEIRRYRLRKKMDLSREINLTTYLSNI